MTSILTDWGKRCIEKLIKGVIAEARFVFCLSCIANEFDEERAKLEPQRKTLEQRVQEAKGRNKNIAANVVSWEEEVVKLFQEDTKTKQNCFFGFCPDCIWRYERGKQLANDTEKIKGLIEKAEKFGNIEVSRPPPGVEHKSSQDYISFESRLSKYNELLDALKDDNNYITGLQGMGGTGKTTLAIKVGKELKESGQFTYVIDTTVSFTPDIKKIQDDIAGPLGLKWEDCNESDRPGKLWDTLTKGEKILLILDDVWDEDPLDFDAIGIPTRGNHKGCRVLVTTRSKQLSNNMNFDKSIELELLSDEDVWTMFKRYANISESSSKDVKKKGREIAKECKKLPVLIAVIASSLRGHHDRMEKWDATLTSLKKPVTLDGVEVDLVGVFNRLKVSYDNMNDEKAKGLFRLCSVFPEDEEISVEVLTRLCIGAGLFGEDYESYNDARNQVVIAKNKLLDYCLLLEVKEKFVKMHDLIRELAQWIARKEIRRVNWTNKNQKSLIEKETNIKCLLFEGSYKDLFFCKFDGSKLETLIAREDIDEDCNVDSDEDCNLKIPNSFFENIAKLRVLYLSCYGNRSLSLANSFQSLKNIRSMMAQKVDLGDISVLGKLQSLETLDLVKCKIHKLPIEIEKLENLKLLWLESCRIRKDNPFEVIRKCSSLEELCFIDSFNDSCQEIILPAKLRRYHIGVGTWGKEMYLSHSKCVVLDEEVYGYFTKGTLEYFMQTAEALQLNISNTDSGWINIMPEMVPIENGMNDLVELHLRFDSELQCLIDTKHIDSQVPNVVFSKLAVLKLEQIARLEELYNGSISLDSFNNLEKLYIVSCRHLKSLFKCSLNLGNLKKLKIYECSTLISVFDLTSSQSLLQLESLDIRYCKQLENIFTYDGDNDNNKSCNSMFPNLKVLSIYGCHQLQFILPCHSAGDLLSLESIMIESCDKLTQLIKYPWDDTIEEKVNGDNDNNSSCNSIMFPNLKKVYVYGCPQLEFVLPLQSAQDLLLLESIIIGSCDKLEYIFGQHQDIQLPSLEELDLRELPNFIDIFPESNHSKHSSIKRSSNSISKTQTQLEPIQSNVFSWSHISCHRYKLNGPTSTEVSLVSEGQPKDFSISLDYFSQGALKQVMQGIKHLRLERINKGWRNLIPQMVPIDQGMNDLTELHLRHDSQLQCLIDNKHVDSQELNVFSKLVVLHLEEMENLEELCNGPISFISMNNLEELYIKGCQNLRSLFNCSLKMCNLKSITLESCSKLVSVFDMSNSQSLPLLESLKISKCEQLENIITYDTIEEMEDWDGYDNKSCCSMFPNLKVLDIHMCPQLQFILPFLSAEDCLLLEVIKISGCYKLKHIFGQHQDVKLASLKEMLIGDSPNFIDIFPESYHSIEGSSNSIFKLQTKLESIFYCLDIWKRAQCLSRSTLHIKSNIKVMTLVNVSEITSVLMLSIAPKVLWESLTVKNCVHLEQIIVDIGDNSGRGDVFPKLKVLYVKNCEKMEYIVGHIKALVPEKINKASDDHQNHNEVIQASDDHQNHNEVTHIHLPALESLKLCSLPSLIGMCTNSYRITFPPSMVLELIDCYKAYIKSFGYFSVPNSISRYHDSTTIKELSGNMEYFLNLKSLLVNNNSREESIFYLNKVYEKKMNLDLQSMEFHNLNRMTDLFIGPKNSFVLKNLTRLKIVQCENLRIVFSTSILRCLPQLINLRIEECNELKYIIEDDLEHKKFTITYFLNLERLVIVNCHKLKCVFPISVCEKLPELKNLIIREANELEEIFASKKPSNFLSTNTCFPKLEGLVIVNCNKLKCVLPISVCKHLPELKILIIREANELEEIFVSESDQKAEIPNLKVVVFDNLPSLCQTQGIQFQAVKNRRVHNCHKISLTSASTSNRIADICNIDDELYGELMLLLQPLKEVSEGQDTCNENPSSEITEEFTVGDVTEAAPGHMLTSSQENGDLGDSEETTQTSNQESKGRDNGNENPSVETTKDFDDEIKVQEPSGHPMSSLQGIKTIVEDGTTSTNSKTVTSSTHSELEVMDEESMDEHCLMNPQDSVGEINTTIKPSQVDKEVGDGKICTPSFSIVNTEPPPTKDVDIGDSQKTIEDPLLEFEKLLTGQVSISSIRILLQALKSLMDSSSNLDHLISNQESKSKLISLFNQLNKHQGILPSHVKEFIEKVQTFFHDNIIKCATFQQVLKKHNQLLDSKTDLMNKLWSAYSTQAHIDNEISTANARIDELSLQIDEHTRKLEDIENQIEDLKSVVNRCNVQKNKLKAECTEWAQQSKELNSALASSEVDVREAERVRNLETEGFANLKSSFPTF